MAETPTNDPEQLMDESLLHSFDSCELPSGAGCATLWLLEEADADVDSQTGVDWKALILRARGGRKPRDLTRKDVAAMRASGKKINALNIAEYLESNGIFTAVMQRELFEFAEGRARFDNENIGAGNALVIEGLGWPDTGWGSAGGSSGDSILGPYRYDFCVREVPPGSGHWDIIQVNNDGSLAMEGITYKGPREGLARAIAKHLGLDEDEGCDEEG